MQAMVNFITSFDIKISDMAIW